MKRRKLFFIIIGLTVLCIACLLASLGLGSWHRTTPQYKMTETARTWLNEAATARAGSRATEAMLPRETPAATQAVTQSPARMATAVEIMPVPSATATTTSTATRLPTAQPPKAVTLTMVRPTTMGTATRAPATWTPRPAPTFTRVILPTVAPPARVCCKICRTGKACGNSCISANKTCHQPPGCACNP